MRETGKEKMVKNSEMKEKKQIKDTKEEERIKRNWEKETGENIIEYKKRKGEERERRRKG